MDSAPASSPAKPVSRISREPDPGAGHPHHQAEDRHQPVVGPQHAGAQRVAAGGAVAPLEARHRAPFQAMGGLRQGAEDARVGALLDLHARGLGVRLAACSPSRRSFPPPPWSAARRPARNAAPASPASECASPAGSRGRARRPRAACPPTSPHAGARCRPSCGRPPPGRGSAQPPRSARRGRPRPAPFSGSPGSGQYHPG